MAHRCSRDVLCGIFSLWAFIASAQEPRLVEYFKPPQVAAGSRYFLQFDAVGAVADVWLNGRHLGKHAGAFSRFRFDASSSINLSGDNVLVVKADNSRPQPGASTQDVIPLSGDCFVFGGATRLRQFDILNAAGGRLKGVSGLLPPPSTTASWSSSSGRGGVAPWFRCSRLRHLVLPKKPRTSAIRALHQAFAASH
jgi:hypothetical protein